MTHKSLFAIVLIFSMSGMVPEPTVSNAVNAINIKTLLVFISSPLLCP